MCGIISVNRYDTLPARKMVARLYRKQKTRGQEGFGFVSFRAGQLEEFRKSEEEGPILEELKKTVGNEILFHHRNPTSTPNFWETAHPIHVSHESLKHDYYVVHNGSINDIDNKKYHDEHVKAGFIYSTLVKNQWTTSKGSVYTMESKWNDSEMFAIELAKDLDKGQAGIRHVWGKIAFVCIQTTKEGAPVSKFWGRNCGSPLKTFYHTNFTSVTSEGKGTEVPVDTLYIHDYTSNKITSKSYFVGYHYEYKGNYDHNEAEWDKDTKTWTTKKKPALIEQHGNGVLDEMFASHLPIDQVAIEKEEADIKRFTEIADQLHEVKKQLEEDIDVEERGYLLNHAANLEMILDEISARYPTIKALG